MGIQDWQYWITTGIAAFAAINSTIARKENKTLAIKNLEYQERLARWEYFPSLSASIEAEENRIQVVVTNSHPQNAVLAYRVKFILRIRASNASFEDETFTYAGGMIKPNSSERIEPDRLNELVKDAIPFLMRGASDPHYNFVVRIFLEADPPHGGPETIKLNKAVRFAWQQSGLVPLPDPNNELA